MGNLATPKRVQKLQTALHAKAKAETGYRQRHCGTGIWSDRDIAAGRRDIETPCASLPTRSPSQPHTPAQKAGVLDLQKWIRMRD